MAGSWVLYGQWRSCLMLSIAVAFIRAADMFALIPSPLTESKIYEGCSSGARESSSFVRTYYGQRRRRPPSLFSQQHPHSPRSRRDYIAGLLSSPAVYKPTAGVDATSSSAASTTQQRKTNPENVAIIVRPATFNELLGVSKLLVAEFYGSTMWVPAQVLVELTRLQNNFHTYGEDADRHLMLVAISADDGGLAGFVDIDGRDKKPGYKGSRPYLSDLAVARRYKRRGVGTQLVRACEAACVDWGYDCMYLKVRAGNYAAEKLYEKIGYSVHVPKDKKNEVVLRGTLEREAAAASPAISTLRGGETAKKSAESQAQRRAREDVERVRFGISEKEVIGRRVWPGWDYVDDEAKV